MDVFDDRRCELGEGPLWHPERGQLFWFDIMGKRLLSRHKDGPLEWQFDEHVSAAGWIDRDRLLIASESALFEFDLATGARRDLVALEADKPANRSNDGRADPWGGFWIGTMGKSAEAGAGAIFRFIGGKVTKVYGEISISNAICFTPDRKFAYFADTVTHQIMRQPLDADGWPDGAASVFVDLTNEALNPDGAVVDADGCLWNAQWGASRVAKYGADGAFLGALDAPAVQVSCPAFGGEDRTTLFATTAAIGLEPGSAANGQVLVTATPVRGQAEHRVVLG